MPWWRFLNQYQRRNCKSHRPHAAWFPLHNFFNLLRSLVRMLSLFEWIHYYTNYYSLAHLRQYFAFNYTALFRLNTHEHFSTAEGKTCFWSGWIRVSWRTLTICWSFLSYSADFSISTTYSSPCPCWAWPWLANHPCSIYLCLAHMHRRPLDQIDFGH